MNTSAVHQINGLKEKAEDLFWEITNGNPNQH